MSRKLYHKQVLINVALAIISGAALILSFPNPGLYPLAWISIVPLMVAIRRSRPVGSFFLGLLTGFVFFSGLLYWIALFGYLPWALLALMQAFYIAVFALLVNPIAGKGHSAIIAIPAIWTAIEWTRSLGMFGFTWGGLAYSQARIPEILQIASITGPWGISFLVVLINTAMFLLITSYNRRSKLNLLAAALIVLVAAGWGSNVIGRIHREVKEYPKRSIALVQGGIEMTWRDEDLLEEIYDTYWPLTEGLKGKPDFIIWPESALPGDLLLSKTLQDEMGQLAQMNGSYMLVGGLHDVFDKKTKDGYREYNGAYLIDPAGKIMGEYYKVRLVPFGEFVPGRQWLPLLDRYQIREIDYSPGDGYHTLRTHHGDLGVMICFESIFPQIARRMTGKGAGLLVVITNDSWFKQTAALSQHFDCSILRAIENRRYVARNATTGISALIAPTGEVIGNSAGPGEKAVVRGQVAMLKGKTFYTRFGDWFVVLCAALGVIGFLKAFLIAKTRNG